MKVTRGRPRRRHGARRSTRASWTPRRRCGRWPWPGRARGCARRTAMRLVDDRRRSPRRSRRARRRRPAARRAARAQAADRAAGLPAFDLLAGAVGEVAHSFGVGPGAIGAAFEQGRPAAGAGAAHGFAGGLVDGQHVVAVEVDCRACRSSRRDWRRWGCRRRTRTAPRWRTGCSRRRRGPAASRCRPG